MKKIAIRSAAVFFVIIQLAAAPVCAQSKVEHIVLVSIDGLREDAVTSKNMPTLFNIKNSSLSFSQAECEFPYKTIPNHVAMVKGESPQSHGYTSNSHLDDNKYVRNTLFSFLRKAHFTSGLYVSKYKLRLLTWPKTANRHIVAQRGNSDEVVDQFLADYENKSTQWNFSLIHLIDPDLTGHAYGWMSSQYIESLKNADKQIAKIYGTLSQELKGRAIIIVVSDHGGEGFDHYADIPEVKKIPFFISRFEKHHIISEAKIRLIDIMPTVLTHFNIAIPDSVEGKSSSEILQYINE